MTSPRAHFVLLLGLPVACFVPVDDFEFTPECGNERVEEGETCDDGNTITEACPAGSQGCMVCNAECQEVKGVVETCGELTGEPCEGTGECGVGVWECSGGDSLICSTDRGGSADESVAEICNDLDDDCNGEADNGTCTLDGWSGRKRITIDGSQVEGSLSEFPVLILLPSDAELAASAQQDGDDILFTAANGTTRYPHEIQSFDGATGALVAWVRVTSLSQGTDAIFYLLYGNATVESQEEPAAVWTNGYAAVWHLDEDPGAALVPFRDSTANELHASASGGVSMAGVVGNCLDLDGTDDLIEAIVPAEVEFGSALTISAWIQIVGNSDAERPFVVVGAASGLPRIAIGKLKSSDQDGRIYLQTAGVASAEAEAFSLEEGAALPTATWIYVSGSLDSARSTQLLHLDGQLQNTETIASMNLSRVGDLRVRLGSSLQGSEYHDGLIDEVRVSVVTRTPAWIQTAYNNQSVPEAFFSVVTE